MLLDLVELSLIQLDQEAATARQAIEIAAKPLIDAGKITSVYVENILKNLKESGPYFVICPHVALPHAASTEGVLKPALGITVLKAPVSFGNQSNDPVKYLFTLAAPNPTSHMSALADLSYLLESEEFYDVLDRAVSVSEVMNYLSKKDQMD